MEAAWPFPDPPKTSVITTRRVVSGSHSIRLVTHDVDDGAWQFLDGDNVWEKDAVIVSLESLVLRDPSLREVADLPRGWQAQRATPTSPWQTTVILDPL